MEWTLIPNNTPDNILNTNITLGKITFDIEAVKDAVRGYLSKYDGLVIQEGEVKVIKSEIAFLRKQKTAINKNRIELSKKYDEPLVTYKENVDSVLDIIEETITALNDQVNIFEEKRKAKKRKQVEDLMEKIKTLRHVPDDFEFDFKDSYLNATTKISAIKEELFEQVNQYEILKKMDEEFSKKEQEKKELLEDTISKLNSKYDFKKPMKYTEYEGILNEIEINKIEEYMNNEAIEREKKSEISETITEKTVPDTEEKINLAIELEISKTQLNLLENFMKEQGIKYAVKVNCEKVNDFDTEFEIKA